MLESRDEYGIYPAKYGIALLLSGIKKYGSNVISGGRYEKNEKSCCGNAYSYDGSKSCNGNNRNMGEKFKESSVE